MTAVIPWGEDELQTLASNPASRVFCEQKRIPVSLQPFHLQDLKSAVRDLLNGCVNSYDKSLDGILLSYKHLKVLSKSASVAAETSGVVLEIQADFYVFRPEIGCILQGVVNKISNDHVGVLLYHRYNISCPRPRSDERSAKWLGNHVVMHQEVTLKLKERDFSGKLPFFKGKLIGVGKVLSKSGPEVQSKSKKKKSKEIGTESLSLPETSGALVSSVQKKSKRRLDNESSDQSHVKKSKKDIEGSSESSKAAAMQCTLNTEQRESLPSKKKKKRVSIGIADEMDFIPSLSLDVSQLPENLPPPNADSTHFDLAKILPSKSVKKRRKENHTDLSSVKEESAGTARGLFKSQNQLNVSPKSLEISDGKSKKKKDKKTCSELDHLKDDPTLTQGWTDLKTSGQKKLHPAQSLPSSSKTGSHVELSLNVHESAKKKKQKGPELISQDQKSAKQAGIQSNKSDMEVPQDFLKKKKKKHEEPAALVEALPPTKDKKSKKDKSANVFDPVRVGKDHALDHISSSSDLFVSSKSKKKSKEEGRTLSPSKHSQKKWEQESQDMKDIDSASDDTIPPGQKIRRVSPSKHSAMGSPRKRESISLGKSPFAPSSSITDYDLGVRKGFRQIPVIIGNLEGKILPPPESPMKSPKKTVRKHDSDSDSPQPKKVILSSSVREQSSDSDSDAANKKHPAGSSRTKSNHAPKQSEGSSDSESDMVVKNKLLQSMGVMQSPLKPAKHGAWQDTYDSESEGSADEKVDNIFSRPQTMLSPTRENGSKPSTKLKKDNKTKSSPTKLSTNVKNKVPEKTQASQLICSDEDDSDSDMEIMKTALQQMEQEKLSSEPSKRSLKKQQVAAKQMTARRAARTQDASKSTRAIPSMTPVAPKTTILGSNANSSSNSAVRGSKNISGVSNDSDSGPEDRNTTVLMEDMRKQRAPDEKSKKSKVSGKELKAQKISATATISKSKKLKSDSEDVKKPSHSKASKSIKGNGGKDLPDEKKQKIKSKKKASSDELSDVIQRLMQQAKLNVGL